MSFENIVDVITVTIRTVVVNSATPFGNSAVRQHYSSATGPIGNGEVRQQDLLATVQFGNYNLAT